MVSHIPDWFVFSFLIWLFALIIIVIAEFCDFIPLLVFSMFRKLVELSFLSLIYFSLFARIIFLCLLIGWRNEFLRTGEENLVLVLLCRDFCSFLLLVDSFRGFCDFVCWACWADLQFISFLWTMMEASFYSRRLWCNLVEFAHLYKVRFFLVEESMTDSAWFPRLFYH